MHLGPSIELDDGVGGAAREGIVSETPVCS